MPPATPSPSPSSSFDSALPALHHALSGSLGTLISTCALYPLSLVITRLQVQRQLRTELSTPSTTHPTARGPHAPTSPRTPSNDNSGGEGTAQSRAQHPGLPADAAAADAETVSPSTRDRQITVRPQEQQHAEGIAEAFSQIWRSDGGPRAFYTGLGGDALKSVLDSFLFFLFYEWFRAVRLSSRRRRGRQGRNLGVVEELAVGMAAGACSRAFTTPMSNIVTRKQAATLVNPDGTSGDLGVRDIIHGIRQEKGIAGLWSGYSATLVLTLNPSLTFLFHEFLKGRFAEQTYDDPGSRLTFLFAATSKAASSFITYPFQIAKTRLQSGIPLDSDEKGKESSATLNGKAHNQEQQGEEDQDIHNEVEKKLDSLRAVQRLAKRSIFGTVAEVIRTEGVASLYDGVMAELLKGFFSHGTTMLAKDVVHKLLFKLYLVTIGVMAELRQRRKLSSQQTNATIQPEASVPRALRYRLDKQSLDDRTGKSKLDYVVNVVANLVDGTQRPFKGE